MKTTSKILTALLVLLFANKSQAQSTTTADAFATIVQPIAITKTVDLNFGNIAVQSTSSGAGAAGGTVVLSPAGGRTKTGGVSLPASPGTVTAASFDVTGDAGRTFTITLPSSNVTLTNTATAGGTMIVNTFTSDHDVTVGLTGGTKTVKVGATLNVSLDQNPGVYQGQFSVTVNYN